MRAFRLLFSLLIFTGLSVKGQTGTEFWYGAPDISYQHANNSVPIYLHVTALYTTTVTISRPADPTFTPVQFNLGPQQTQSIRLDNDYGGGLLPIDQIETYARDKTASNFLQNKGFLIQSSPGEITAYVEYTGSDKSTGALNNNNPDIISLKAANALGKNFWVSTQRKYMNHPYSDDFSGFVVVATQNNTQVTIDPNGNNLYKMGTTPFTVTLNKGQTFSVRAAGQAPGQHIFGIKVTSTQDIAITLFDDSMQIDDGGGNWDLFADQDVPVNLVGDEYIVLKGKVQDLASDTADGEAVFITPTVNNTDVYVNDTLVASNLQAGQYFSYVIKDLATDVRATQPVYVNHITGYSTSSTGARELGGAVLPTIDGCTGSHTVTVKRSPAPGFVFFNNLMVRNDTVKGSPTRNQAIYHFTYSINGGPPQAMNPNYFTYIMDSAFAFYDRTKAGGAAYYNKTVDGDVIRVDNNIARFHLGVMQGKQSPGCKYGYFSDYAQSGAQVGIGGFTQGSLGIFCNLNPVQIVANGGTSYKWYTPYDPALVNKLDNDTAAAPYFSPDTAGAYFFNVIITGECFSRDTLQTEVIILNSTTSDFSFSSDIGCSPFAPVLTNLSDTVLGVTQLWTIKTATAGSYQINQDTIPRTFPLLLPENHSDTEQVNTVSLVVKGAYNSCPTQKSKDIIVKPQVNASFTASDTIGCHPLPVNFTNTSTGHIDSTSFLWNFGDNTQSFEINPSKTYSNYGLNDSTYHVSLVVESPLACYDTAWQDIVVHPRVHASMAIDKSESCSPLDAHLNPANTKGADTLFWQIDGPYSSKTVKTQSLALYNLTHTDTTILAGPDTLSVMLTAENRMGCADTFPAQKIVVYPDVIANFSVTDTTICDSTPILFKNTSFGYKLFNNWDFGDGTVSQDTTSQSYQKVYYNRSTVDSLYHVQLTATSEYLCQSTKDTIIKVHPYVKANFGLDYNNNCAPLSANITNLSVNADQNWWDYGNGTLTRNDTASYSHIFYNNSSSNDTTYHIKLIAKNNLGCNDTLTRNLKLFPQVVASFHMDDSTGCSPRLVTFHNTSKGGLLNYLWEFGNNTSSVSNSATFTRNFTNLSQNDTTYHVKLTASNPFGCSSQDSGNVNVFASIISDFSLPVTDSCSPFTIRPTNLSSSGAKVFEWDLGPLGTSSLKDPVITPYTNNSLVEDTVNISLIAYGQNDVAHKACADTHQVRVVIYPEMNTNFTLDKSLSCQPYQSAITNNSNIKTGTTFLWTLDGNFYSSDQNPVTLNIPNLTSANKTHTLKLFGTTNHGCTDTLSKQFTVYSLVDAYFTIDRPAICSGDSFQIDRTSSRGGITSYNWNFNNEQSSATSTAKFYHQFNNLSDSVPLNKFVTLTVKNTEGCDSSITKTINVDPKVVAAFSPDYNAICYPHNSAFTNTTQHANYYFWEFGDGSGSNAKNPSHTYQNLDLVNDKTYSVKLVARSNYNCYDSIKKNVTIYAKPYADFYFPKTIDCPPFNASMVNQSQGNNLTYAWDFAGQGTSTDQNPSFTFSNETSAILDQPIKLTITSARGCTDTLTKSLRVYPNVHVNFTLSDSMGCSPLTVNFTGQTVNVTKMFWYIDNKAFSTLNNTSYRFVDDSPDNQTFQIKFKAYSLYNCVDSITKPITLYPSPSAEFIPDPILQDYNTQKDKTTVTFSNETFFQNNWSYEWDYGNGKTDNQSKQTFDYTYGNQFWGDINNENKVPVKLYAWNSDNPGCRDSVEHDIIINPPLPEIDLKEDVEGCEPFTVDFSAVTKYIDGNYQWDFGDNNGTSTEATPSYTYTKPGVYTAKLVVHGDGGTNWDYKTITVDPKPEVNFTFNDSVVFVSTQNRGNDTVNFYNLTKYGNYYKWYFDGSVGDTAESEEKDPSWHYTTRGVYYPTLVAESDQGCWDTLTSKKAIYVVGEGRIKFPTGIMVNPYVPGQEWVSSNYDTKTNIFRPVANGVLDYNLEIYNRWGVLVFTSNNVNHGWNGYIDGKHAKQDVYLYRAKGHFSNGEPFKVSGDFTLIIYDENQTP